MSSVVPEDWNTLAVNELFDFNNGKAFYTDGYSDKGFRVIDLLNISLTGRLNINHKDKFVSPEVYRKYPKAHLKENDLIFIMTDITPSLGLIGKTAVIDKNNTYVLNQRVGCLRPKTDISMSIWFFNYLFNSEIIRLQVIRETLGTAQFYLNTPSIKNLSCPTPPLPEQKKIASILISVDEVIEKTQSKINKLQDLKKGMMNELLIKGIGHTEFKDSVLGRIPKSWEVVSIMDSNITLLDGDRGKEYPKEKDFTKSGYCLFLSAKNVTKNGFRFDETMFISKDKDEKLGKGRLNRNDMIITTRGTVGNIAQYDRKVLFDFVRINSGMAIIRNQDERLSSDFLYHILSSEIITQQIEYLTFGSAQPQLTIGTLNELKIPIPQISEQLNIVQILTSILKDIQNKKQKLTQTQSLKKSLMQDLLTGKVRVKVN